MKILWLCNIMLPAIAKHSGVSTSVKEGWLDGLFNALSKGGSNITLAVAFPSDHEFNGLAGDVKYYAFTEDRNHPEIYDNSLEDSFRDIIRDFNPDIIHCFGTEYPHTLAIARAFNKPSRLLIGIQGLMYVYTDAYRAGLPDSVWNRSTFRDIMRKDSLVIQRKKYEIRGGFEKEALLLTSHITGRTAWDKHYTARINSNAAYHFMNETLRSCFYGPVWEKSGVIPHSIFVSQANYPIKGFHFLLKALPLIKEKYPDVKVYAAGDNITRHSSFKEKLKLSSYGLYLLELIKQYNLENNIFFTGPLDQNQMLSRYLMSQVFVSPSSIENSPNSVGEAMLLGMNVVTSNAGGVTSMLEHNKEGLVYPVSDTKALADAINYVFDPGNDDHLMAMRKAAAKKASITHDPETNRNRLIEIYREILN